VNTRTKAGFVEAPCTLLLVEGEERNDVCMKVERVERDMDRTTFIGRGVFRTFTKLVIPNEKWVALLAK
jgi:hypothetical protein